MKTKRYPVFVEAFHYDVIGENEEKNTDIQVSLDQVVPADEENQEELKAGNVYQLSVPFDVTVSNFKVSGMIKQIVQIIDFFGEVKDIAPDDVRRLSRPLVEYIETLTYQVTAVALDKGVQLNFTANEETIEPEA